jgi:EXLDI family protein
MNTDPHSTMTTPSAGIDITKGEFDEILLRVGPGGGRRQRFFGKLVGEAKEFTKAGIDVVRVYVSRKGKYVVHRQRSEWSDIVVLKNWTEDWKNLREDWKGWREMFDFEDQGWGDYSVEIVDTFEELADRVPAKIYRGLVDVAQHPQTEDLDV